MRERIEPLAVCGPSSSITSLPGRSYRDVMAGLGCSHRDVAAARKVGPKGITEAGPAQMSDTELTRLFSDRPLRPSVSSSLELDHTYEGFHSPSSDAATPRTSCS